MKNNDITIKDIEEFVEYVFTIIEDDNELFVTTIAKFNKMQEIIKEVMTYKDVNFEVLHLESPDASGYTDEYVLSFWVNDGILELGCEPLKVDGEYLHHCGDITFLFEDCSSKIIPLCETSKLYFVNSDEEFDYNEGNASSSYFINGIPVAKEEFNKTYKDFRDKIITFLW